MKIRIKENTVRYRLSKSEVSMLVEEEMIEEKTEFISQTLHYKITKTKADFITADFVQNTITLYIPQHLLQQWASTEQVSVHHHLLLSNGNTLYLLLEKDFKCIDAPVTEDQSDYFDNPHKAC